MLAWLIVSVGSEESKSLTSLSTVRYPEGCACTPWGLRMLLLQAPRPVIG